MNPKTRLERLPKKDRDFISHWVGMRPEMQMDLARLVQDEKRILQTNLKGMCTRPATTGYLHKTEADLIPGGLRSIAGQVLQYGIANRLLRDSPPILTTTLLAASRLQYLSNLLTTRTYSGGDCYHVFDIFLSLAANDSHAVAAYVRRYSDKATKGHPFTVLLCNSITAILQGRAEEVPLEKLRARKDALYDQAMLAAVAAIVERDGRQLEDQLDIMLKGHRRKEINGAMLKFYPVPVHALYRMACDHFHTAGLPLPAEPSDILWDREVHARQRESDSLKYLEYIQILSPVIATWASELPVALSPEQFVDVLTR